VGTLVWDRILDRDGRSQAVEEWGGIAYALSALGAAWLAGLATNIWPSLDALTKLPRTSDRFEPSMSRAERDERYAGWTDAVRRALGPRLPLRPPRAKVEGRRRA